MDTAKKLSLSRQQLLVMLAPAVLLMGIGIYGVHGGFITTGKPTVADSTAVSIDLSPPAAKPHDLKNDIKYDNSFSTGDLKPSVTRPQLDEQAQASSQLLTGQSARIGLGSNEQLTNSDLQRVEQAGSDQPVPSKAQVSRQYAAANKRTQRDQERVLRTLHQAPRSHSQIAEEQQAQEERVYNRQATERLLRQIEGASQTGPAPNQAALEAIAQDKLYMTEYQTLKRNYGGQLPAEYQRLFSRKIDAERQGQARPPSNENLASVTGKPTVILPARYESETGTSSQNAFYSMGGRALKATNMPNSTNLSIPAVIHGEGDHVTVSTGSTVKIRLLEATQLLLNGELVMLPANSLVSGICQIADERILITVNTVRKENYLYETDLVAYDLDGRAGLHVPHLNEKNRMAQTLGQTAQSSALSPYYFLPQGGIGQQVGAQVAVQAGTSLFQGARSLLQSKLTNPKATVRSNYRIFLKSGGRTGAGKALADF
jgi:hypothetical protein